MRVNARLMRDTTQREDKQTCEKFGCFGGKQRKRLTLEGIHRSKLNHRLERPLFSHHKQKQQP